MNLGRTCSVLGPRSPTRAANPFDDEPMPLAGEVVLLGQEHRHPLQTLIAKLDHSAAHGADEVLVVRLIARRLEPTKSFAEVALDDESGAEHHIERTIDRRGRHRRTASPQLSFDLVGRHVPVATQDDFGDGLPLRRHGEIVVAQVGEKRLYGRGAVHGSAVSA